MKTIALSNQTGLLRRIGMAGFCFFFVKGILWLLAPFVFLWFSS